MNLFHRTSTTGTGRGRSRPVLVCLATALMVATAATAATAGQSGPPATQKSGNLQDMQVRKVDNLVSQMPDTFDLSTPEAACASWNRAWARQDARQLVLADVGQMGRETMQTMLEVWRKQAPAWADGKSILEARIVEVLTWQDSAAWVIVRSAKGTYRIRVFGNMHGQWKNMGEDGARTVEAAEAAAAGKKDAFVKMYQAWLEADTQRRQAEQHPEIIERVAAKFFQNLRSANYSEGGRFDLHQLPYEGPGNRAALAEWMCTTFRANPIVDAQVGKPFKGDDGFMAVSYKLTLRDGTVLQGDLSFNWSPNTKAWFGMQGMEWATRYNGKPLVAGTPRAQTQPAAVPGAAR